MPRSHRLFRWFCKIALLMIAALGVRMAAEDTKPTAPAAPAPQLQAMPKFRQWNQLETAQMEIINLRYELLKRIACESIDVKFADCNFDNGFVTERPKPTAAGAPAPASIPAKVEEKKTEPKK